MAQQIRNDYILRRAGLRKKFRGRPVAATSYFFGAGGGGVANSSIDTLEKMTDVAASA